MIVLQMIPKIPGHLRKVPGLPAPGAEAVKCPAFQIDGKGVLVTLFAAAAVGTVFEKQFFPLLPGFRRKYPGKLIDVIPVPEICHILTPASFVSAPGAVHLKAPRGQPRAHARILLFLLFLLYILYSTVGLPVGCLLVAC